MKRSAEVGLETDKATLQAKLDRQQIALHEAVVIRDRQIEDLRKALTQRLVTEPPDGASEDSAALRGLVTDLERRLAAQTSHRASMEARLAAAQATAARERSARIEAERDRDRMRHEFDAIETSLRATGPGEPTETCPRARLDGVVLLYVGGRPSQVAPMRTAVERLGATFLHHDGGVENHTNLLPGLASRSNVVLFPVDCISHDAAN